MFNHHGDGSGGESVIQCMCVCGRFVRVLRLDLVVASNVATWGTAPGRAGLRLGKVVGEF